MFQRSQPTLLHRPGATGSIDRSPSVVPRSTGDRSRSLQTPCVQLMNHVGSSRSRINNARSRCRIPLQAEFWISWSRRQQCQSNAITNFFRFPFSRTTMEATMRGAKLIVASLLHRVPADPETMLRGPRLGSDPNQILSWPNSCFNQKFFLFVAHSAGAKCVLSEQRKPAHHEHCLPRLVLLPKPAAVLHLKVQKVQNGMMRDSLNVQCSGSRYS